MKTECQKETVEHPLKGKIALRDLDDIESLAILSSLPTLGSTKIRLLIKYFGSALEALLAPVEEIAVLPGFGTRSAQEWVNWPSLNAWKHSLALAERNGVKLISFMCPEYPRRLLEIPDHPVLLYVKGELHNKDACSLAIVGTRQASIYGLEAAAKISKDLACMGFTIVSGLARGVDTKAHTGALHTGRTIAVIGSGLANIYPQENRELASAISEKGAVISELPMDAPPDRKNFPQRNRIVSGMTLGTVLIEAPLQSGAMITMDRARSQNRQLFALPGRVDTDSFKGNHLLIKNGDAHLVESAEDIARHFNDFFGSKQPQKTVQPQIELSLEREEKELMQLLPNEELSIEEIQTRTKLPIIKLNVLIMSLVLKKAIKEYPGKVYKKSIH